MRTVVGRNLKREPARLPPNRRAPVIALPVQYAGKDRRRWTPGRMLAVWLVLTLLGMGAVVGMFFILGNKRASYVAGLRGDTALVAPATMHEKGK